MQFLVLIHVDQSLIDAMPPGEFDETMRHCFVQADAMRHEGKLLDSMQLEGPEQAKSIRVRRGRTTVTDGPFAEAKEVLGGFNLIEAPDMDAAMEIALQFPWSAFGCVEVRPVRDIDAVRNRVGAQSANAAPAPAT